MGPWAGGPLGHSKGRTVPDKRRSVKREAAAPGLALSLQLLLCPALSTLCLLTHEPRHNQGDVEAQGPSTLGWATETPSVIQNQYLQISLPYQVEIQAPARVSAVLACGWSPPFGACSCPGETEVAALGANTLKQSLRAEMRMRGGTDSTWAWTENQCRSSRTFQHLQVSKPVQQASSILCTNSGSSEFRERWRV